MKKNSDYQKTPNFFNIKELINKRENMNSLKLDKGCEHVVHKREIQIAYKHLKSLSTSLVSKEIYIKMR